MNRKMIESVAQYAVVVLLVAGYIKAGFDFAGLPMPVLLV